MPEPSPTLAEPYATALTEAVAYLHERYAPIGIVVSGTIVRGAPQASSDLDIVAIHEQPWRQRIQRRFNGVPTETFVNPPFQVRRQMERDAREGRPVMAHMLATGTIVHDPTGITGTLRQEAVVNLEAGPDIDQAWLKLRRYGIATMFEDAVDLRGIDPDRASTLATEALIEGVKWHFLGQGRWLPRSKALLPDLDKLDPELGHGVRNALRARTVDERIALAAPALDRLIGATGFFDWDGEPQDVP